MRAAPDVLSCRSHTTGARSGDMGMKPPKPFQNLSDESPLTAIDPDPSIKPSSSYVPFTEQTVG